MWKCTSVATVGLGKFIAHFERMKFCGCGMERTTKLFDYKPTKEQAENEINN